MPTNENAESSTDTLTTFPVGSVEQLLLQEFTSYCGKVAAEFRCNVLSEYPQKAKTLVISMYLQEKRITAQLIRDKARLMSREDQYTCFWGAYLYWCDAISCIDWLITQLHHAKPR